MPWLSLSCFIHRPWASLSYLIHFLEHHCRISSISLSITVVSHPFPWASRSYLIYRSGQVWRSFSQQIRSFYVSRLQTLGIKSLCTRTVTIDTCYLLIEFQNWFSKVSEMHNIPATVYLKDIKKKFSLFSGGISTLSSDILYIVQVAISVSLLPVDFFASSSVGGRHLHWYAGCFVR